MEGDRDEMEDDDWMDTRWAEPGSCHMITNSGDVSTSNRLENIGQDRSTSSMTGSVSSGPGAELMSRMQLNDNKAGMEGLDKEKINQVIFEASKGSKYFENERKKEEQVKKRILEQQMKQEKIPEAQLRQGLEEADKLLNELEESRDLSHTIVHIDMDAFYAAVEMRDDPSLRDKPMAVGGIGMLSTSNYLARKFGVRAAMPGFIGKKLCPELIIVKANFKQYNVVSQQVRHILGQYDPNFSPMSLDEAYLDITEHLKKRQSMGKSERSFLLRSCNKWDTTLCVCDLNEVIINPDSSSAPEHQSQVPHFIGNQSDVSSATRNIQSELLSDINKAQSEVSINALDQSESCMKINDQSEALTLRMEESLWHIDNKVREVSSSRVCTVCGKLFPPYITQVFGTTPEEAVHEMRSRIEQKTRLTASAGIAPNTMLAKVCSDRNKPNGQYRIQPTKQAVMDFIQDLPIRKISGIGKVSETMLRALGVVKCPDLYRRRDLLYHLYSPISFNHFMRICLAIGSTTVERDGDRKSMSTERTFGELSRPSDLYKKCSELCAALVEDLTDEELRGKTVGIKIKTVTFEVKTRAHSLPHHTADYEDIFKAARELLRVEILAVQPQPLRLRLMGVRLSNLLPVSMCEEKKQDTITGLFRKMAAKSPQKLQNPFTHPELCSDRLPLLPSLDLDSTGGESCVGAGHQHLSHMRDKITGGEQTKDSQAENRSNTAEEEHVLVSHGPGRTLSSRAQDDPTILNPKGRGKTTDICDDKKETLNESTNIPLDNHGATSAPGKQKTVKMLFKPKAQKDKKEINNNTDHSAADSSTTGTHSRVTASRENTAYSQLLAMPSNELGIEKNIENISTAKSGLNGVGGRSATSVNSVGDRTNACTDKTLGNIDSADTKLAKTPKRERNINTNIDYNDFMAELDGKDYRHVVEPDNSKMHTPSSKTKKKPGRKKNSTMVASPAEGEESSGYESSKHSDGKKSSVALVETISVKKGKKTKNTSTRTKKQRSSKTSKEDQSTDNNENLRSVDEEQTRPANVKTKRVTSGGDDSVSEKTSVPKETRDVQNLKQFQCPVCHSRVESKNLNYFNDHVDVCLFRQISSQEQAEDQPIDKNTGTQVTNEDRQSDAKGTKNKTSVTIPQGNLCHNTPSIQLTDQSKQINYAKSSKEDIISSSSKLNQKCKSTSASDPSELTANVLIRDPFSSEEKDVSAKILAVSHFKEAGSSGVTNQEAISANVNDISKSVQNVHSSITTASTSFHENERSETVSRMEEEAEFYACPICNVEKLGCSLQEFNEHVDSCLSRRAIKQILQEQRNLPAKPPTGKRVASTSPSQPPAKRRKSDIGSKMKTIESFFKS